MTLGLYGLPQDYVDTSSDFGIISKSYYDHHIIGAPSYFLENIQETGENTTSASQ